jgi:hypothetical protein
MTQKLYNTKFIIANITKLVANEQGVGARSLVHNILGVEGCVETLGWD